MNLERNEIATAISTFAGALFDVALLKSLI